jgi:CubicO group peptidase (beta-lactamase class C family)
MISEGQIAKKPEDVGVDSERLEALFARARRDVEQGLLGSVQVAVARQGRVAGMRTFGSALQGGRSQPATDRTLYPLFSCTKGIVGIATWALLEEGLVRLDERVADIVPGFGANGKGGVTVEHLLLQQSGFPHAGLSLEQWVDRSKRLEAFASWRLDWEPGSRFAYHLLSAHFVIAEIIQRRTGMDHCTFIRERMATPMGLDELFVGAPPEVDPRVAEFRMAMASGTDVVGEDRGVRISPQQLLELNKPELRRLGIPGGGGIGGAAELALYYQPLVNSGVTADGRRIFEPETIERATRIRTRVEQRDPMFGNVSANRALGVIVAGDDGQAHLRGFGKTASPRAFGQPGAGGQIAWGDPKSGISVGYCLDGFSDWVTQGRRTTAISSLAGSCAVA